MHCELMLSGLPAPQARRPALELLLARGRLARRDPEVAADWLARRCGLEPLPAGALCAGEPGLWVRADPVHYRVMRDRVVVVPAEGVDATTAESLIAALNRHFAGRHAFRAVTPEAWVMSVPEAPAPLAARAPAAIAGRDFSDVLPGAPWPALLNEIQMVLHEHPAAEPHEAGVNGVWLWGAGALPERISLPWRSIAGGDCAARGLARAAGIDLYEAPADAVAWLARLPGEGRHAALLGPLAPAMEEAWCAPLVEALRAGRIGMLSVHLPEAGLACEAVRLDLRRFWRRARPLEAHAHR